MAHRKPYIVYRGPEENVRREAFGDLTPHASRLTGVFPLFFIDMFQRLFCE